MMLRTRLERLQRVAPKRHASGMLYAERSQLKRAYRRITLYVMLLSVENTHLLHSAIFEKRTYRTPQQWAEWMSRNFSEVYTRGILPGVALRTGGKSWAVERIIGWIGNAKYSVTSARMDRKRHQTQSKRRANG